MFPFNLASSLWAGLLSSLLLCVSGCGPRPRPTVQDSGEPDAGVELDAGRLRGEDPPTGWQMVAALPDGGALASKLGVYVAAVGDQFEQPLVAALFQDPNGDLNYDDNRVVFTRWDGQIKAFEPLKTVETVGGGPFERPHRQLSIARDPETGRIGIAYVKPQGNVVRLAVSDDEGANFSLTTVSEEPRAALMSNPALVLRGGNVHLGWLEGSDVVYRKKVGAGAFVEQRPAGVLSGGRSLALGVDSAGDPALAFFVGVGANSADLAFWRPGGSVRVLASGDMLDLTQLGREPSVSLSFVGTTPHLAYHLRNRVDADATELWYLKANDAGSSWSTPVAIPRNSSSPTEFHSTRWSQALTVEPSGRVSIVAPRYGPGGSSNCKGPKLSRSPDGLMFTTCSPPGSPIERDADWVNLWTHRPGNPGKQTLVFHYDNPTNPQIRAGIVMWREP